MPVVSNCGQLKKQTYIKDILWRSAGASWNYNVYTDIV